MQLTIIVGIVCSNLLACCYCAFRLEAHYFVFTLELAISIAVVLATEARQRYAQMGNRTDEAEPKT